MHAYNILCVGMHVKVAKITNTEWLCILIDDLWGMC